MSTTTREERLRVEFEAMQALQASSSIIRFETEHDPPDRYSVTFRGKGVCRDTSATRPDVVFVDLHRVEIRLASSYPERGPDIRWQTPIFHPNISFSGFINLKEIGLPWDREITLDIVCERLWDMARMAYYNLDKATHYAAKSWFEKDSTLRLPLDQRPLRDQAASSGSNTISYARRGGRRVTLPESSDADVLFIGDDSAADPPRRRPPRPPARPGDDDILFIGDD